MSRCSAAEPRAASRRKGTALRPSLVQSFSGVIGSPFSDDAAHFNAAIEPGAVDLRSVNRASQQLLEVPAWEVEPSAGEHHFADLEALADEVAQRHPARREIAAVLCGRKLDLLAGSRRITPRDCLEHFHFDQRHLARIRLWRVGAGAIEIAIAFNAPAGDKLALLELLHHERCSRRDMNVQQAAGPAHSCLTWPSCSAGSLPLAADDDTIPPPAVRAG